MLTHLIAVIALAALCGAWVLFQRWLKRVDPDARGVEDDSGCSGNCRRDRNAAPMGRAVQLAGRRDPGPAVISKSVSSRISKIRPLR
jgi:hypothetical protein